MIAFNWNEVEHTYAYHQYNPIHAYSEYHKISNNLETKTFTNCPKYLYLQILWTSLDDQTISATLENKDIIKDLLRKNKIKSLTFKSTKNP